MSQKADPGGLPADAAAHPIERLLSYQDHGIASRILLRSPGGNVTLFTFDAGEGLSEHTSPFEALVVLLDGQLAITVGREPVTAAAGDVVRLPAGVPHALAAEARSRMILIMLRGEP